MIYSDITEWGFLFILMISFCFAFFLLFACNLKMFQTGQLNFGIAEIELQN